MTSHNIPTATVTLVLLCSSAIQVQGRPKTNITFTTESEPEFIQMSAGTSAGFVSAVVVAVALLVCASVWDGVRVAKQQKQQPPTEADNGNEDKEDGVKTAKSLQPTTATTTSKTTTTSTTTKDVKQPVTIHDDEETATDSNDQVEEQSKPTELQSNDDLRTAIPQISTSRVADITISDL